VARYRLRVQLIHWYELIVSADSSGEAVAKAEALTTTDNLAWQTCTDRNNRAQLRGLEQGICFTSRTFAVLIDRDYRPCASQSGDSHLRRTTQRQRDGGHRILWWVSAVMFQVVEIGRHNRAAVGSPKARSDRLLGQARFFACGYNRMSEGLHNYPLSALKLDVRHANWSNIYGDTK
jgi:hypothetical protein